MINYPINNTDNHLKHRFITDANGKSHLVNKVYVGSDLIFKETEIVDMGLPSGTLWAVRDIDITKPDGFCETPFTYEKSFFSWGNTDGHNPISNSTFDYNWGGINSSGPYYEGQVYGETTGSTLTESITLPNDAANVNLGGVFRMPTSAEFVELFANIRYINADGTEVDTTNTDKRVEVNGVKGLYIESKINGARLFFSCSGSGGSSGKQWNYSGGIGFYWCSSIYSSRSAQILFFNSSGVNPSRSNDRYYGIPVRPVLRLT